MPGQHKEIAFEAAIDEHLLNVGGYTKGNPKTFDCERAIDPDVFFSPLSRKRNPKNGPTSKASKKENQQKYLLTISAASSTLSKRAALRSCATASSA
jgi:hypothetical protein